MRIAALVVALLLTPVGSPTALADGSTRVVVVQTLRLEPFQRAEAALIAELSSDMDIRVVHVEPGTPEARARLHDLEPDILVPIGTQAAVWVSEVTQGIPIVFAMVLDPVSGGLVASFERPSGRISGAALDVPLSNQFRMAREVLRAKRIAVLFNPEHSGALIASAKRQARAHGIELVGIPVESRASFESALHQVDGSFDALWSIPDTVVFSRRLTQRILLYTIRRRIPLVGLSEQHVRAGALYALVTSFEENGRQAADIVRRVAAGEQAGQIPLERPEQLEVVFNPRTAENLRVRLPGLGFTRLRPVR